MSVQRIIDKSRNLSQRGCYGSAIKLLESARHVFGETDELDFELAEVFLMQGYLNRAAELIQQRLWQHDSPLQDATKLMFCVLKIMTTGQVSANAIEADKIRQKYGSIVVDGKDWRHLANIEIYYFKTISISSILHASSYDHNRSSAERNLCLVIDKLIIKCEMEVAFQFAVALQNLELKLSYLESILKHERTPVLVAAKTRAQLADSHIGTVHRSLRKELRSFARPVLEKFHLHAVLDIELAECLEGILDREQSPMVGDHLDELMNKYRNLKYPNGLQKWLRKILDIAVELYNFDLQHSLEDELTNISISTGSRSFQLMTAVTQVARNHQMSGNEDLVKTTMRELYYDLQPYDLPFYQGQAAFVLTDIYASQKNSVEATAWAQRCEVNWSKYSNHTLSMSRIQVLRSKMLEVEMSGSSDYHLVQSMCDEYVEFDLENNLQQEAISKLQLLTTMFYTCKGLTRDERVSSIRRIIDQISKVQCDTPGTSENGQRAKSLQQLASFQVLLGSGENDIRMELDALETYKEALQLTHAESKGGLTLDLIIIRQQMGLVSHTCFSKLKDRDISASKVFLNEAEESFKVCLQGYQAISLATQITEAHYWIALVRYESRIMGWTSSEDIMDSLLSAETGYDARRMEINISTGLNAISTKQQISKEKHLRDIYRFAFQICLLDRDNNNAWQWVQKAKARSVSDSLGLGYLIPKNLWTEVFEDVTCKDMLEREKILLDRLQQSKITDKFTIRTSLRRLQNEMESIPSLQSLLRLRRGTSVTAEELWRRWQLISSTVDISDIAFVDWYVKNDDEIYILIQQYEKPIQLRRVNATVQVIKAWTAMYLHSDQGKLSSLDRADDHPNQALRQMDCLIEALGDLTDENVLLVLCPATPLDVVPLHALHVRRGKKASSSRLVPLIERNPVIYCANLTVFIQCCELVASKKHDSPRQYSLMAVYEGTETETCDGKEKTEVYECIDRLAMQHGISALKGLEVTCDKIAEQWSDADIILFHGHCDLSPDDITKQSLVLAERDRVQQRLRYPSLTIARIFDFKLRGPLVSLMACGSSTQNIQPGDEPLGLVTALLCAGAATVVGSLWPIASATAREFTRTFDQKIRDLEKANHTIGIDQNSRVRRLNAINLAIAMQQTVRDLKRSRSTRTPYHWAAFVLHGSMILKTAA